MITSHKALRRLRTLLRNSFQRIVFAITGVIAIGLASVSLGQFHESGAVPCGGCQGHVARCGLGNCSLAGYAAGVRDSAAILRHRETPPGNMGLHFPYHANQMYYYRRPYNDYHVPTHVEESRNSSAQSSFGGNLGYSNQIFEQAHSAAEEYHNSLSFGEAEEDGLLEFVDWTKHRQSRLNWESIPRYHSEQQSNPYPYLNEEVMNQRPSRGQDFELGRSAQPLRR